MGGESFIQWAFIDAVWQAEGVEACVAASGACWPFVGARWEQLLYGFYPQDARWRVDIAFFIGFIPLMFLMHPLTPYKRFITCYLLLLYPVITFYLLSGGVFNLSFVETSFWGGMMVTLIVAITGMVAALPFGILLALGRRSSMPLVRYLCIGFIELWRGVPLITVLFIASVMLPLFLPEGMNFDKLLRCLVGVAMFSAAYMAEVVRSGLQSISKGQYETATALGLGYWKSMILIILPQALKRVIPGIVNTFIGLFKDTTLVLIIGLYDFLGVVQAGFSDANWAAPQVRFTGYAFAALVYWVLCFAMSRYSLFIEKKLATGEEA